MNHFITKKRGKHIIAHFQDWFDQIQKINMCLHGLIRTRISKIKQQLMKKI